MFTIKMLLLLPLLLLLTVISRVLRWTSEKEHHMKQRTTGYQFYLLFGSIQSRSWN